MRNVNVNEPQNQQSCQTSVMVSADGLNVVSLFNGMNTGRQALENQGFNVNKYYSSEIKPYAIELTQHHFPDTIQVGDVTKWKDWDIDWKSIDLILSGSPCQDLSIAGKSAGINGSKSSLFFTFIEIYNHTKELNPNVIFFQENVGSANVTDIGIMSRSLGLYPTRINSDLVVAASRDRYYWTNIRTKRTMFDVVTDIPEPKDRKIMFKDIITDGFTDRKKSTAIMERYHGSFYNDESSENAQKYIISRDSIGMCPIVYLPGGKARTLNKIEMCRLQGFKDNYCDILSKKDAASLLGDGWTLPIVEHIFSFMHKTKH